MSSSNRSPKNLRDFVDKSKLEYEFDKAGGVGRVSLGDIDVEESLKNLRNLSQEEKTEIGMLKSRVDEQSRLIMSLKQRADDFIRKNITLEKLNSDLNEKNEQHDSEILQLNARFKDLLDKFNYLGNNHEQLIVIKDEYKHKNEELVAKNKLLMEKFKNVPNESEFLAEKVQLQEKLDGLSKNYIELEHKYLDVCNDNEKKNKQIAEDVNALKVEKQKSEEMKVHLKELHDMNEQFKTRNKELLDLVDHLENDSKNSNEKQLKRIAELAKEKEDLYNLCDKLKKELKISIDSRLSVEQNYINVCQELNKQKELYSKHTLHSDLDKANKKYTELEMQFDAYKRHTNGLLEKERELNNKLKFMLN